MFLLFRKLRILSFDLPFFVGVKDYISGTEKNSLFQIGLIRRLTHLLLALIIQIVNCNGNYKSSFKWAFSATFTTTYALRRTASLNFYDYHSSQCLVYEAVYIYIVLFYCLRHTCLKTYGLRFYGHQWVLETGLLWLPKLLNEIPHQGVRWVTRGIQSSPYWQQVAIRALCVCECVCSHLSQVWIHHITRINHLKS